MVSTAAPSDDLSKAKLPLAWVVGLISFGILTSGSIITSAVVVAVKVTSMEASSSAAVAQLSEDLTKSAAEQAKAFSDSIHALELGQTAQLKHNENVDGELADINANIGKMVDAVSVIPELRFREKELERKEIEYQKTERELRDRLKALEVHVQTLLSNG